MDSHDPKKELRTILIADQTFTYFVKRSTRARRLRLSFTAEQILHVTAPLRVSMAQVEQVLRSHAQWIVTQLTRVRAHPRRILPAVTDTARYREYKQMAKRYAEEYLAELAARHVIPSYSVSIRNHRARWGSCSRTGKLCFNYRIALLPEALAEYIIIHEVSHLFELNHSVRFWNRVASFLPDYKVRRVSLREYTWNKD